MLWVCRHGTGKVLFWRQEFPEKYTVAVAQMKSRLIPTKPETRHRNWGANNDGEDKAALPTKIIIEWLSWPTVFCQNVHAFENLHRRKHHVNHVHSGDLTRESFFFCSHSDMRLPPLSRGDVERHTVVTPLNPPEPWLGRTVKWYPVSMGANPQLYMGPCKERTYNTPAKIKTFHLTCFLQTYILMSC